MLNFRFKTINFNNSLLNSCFSNKNSSVTIQTHTTQIVNSVYVYIHIKKPVLTESLKNISLQNQLPITFDTN